ncbi:MAG: restriction endonuclease [Acidobacteria bacterium]|nr:restriction endonuclease [Acidobacteriota bacterium]MYA44986.1 restriction endonuclease [Acidobacteriota bacterium]MYI38563.1 restriction endonuclease [Acidobacteriota bacterium]
MFEKAIRQAFREQGYEVKQHRHHDGQGDDADIVVSPPARHGLLQPEEVAVQVKWKEGVDANDEAAVDQIVKWAKSQKSNALKYAISSATGFTENVQSRAAEEQVVLIGGLQTMCFLLGVPDRYRADWEGDG